MNIILTTYCQLFHGRYRTTRTEANNTPGLIDSVSGARFMRRISTCSKCGGVSVTPLNIGADFDFKNSTGWQMV